MSKVALSALVEVKVRVASHLLNVPSIATDASTSNLILLSIGVISNTGTPVGACARVTVGKRMEAKRERNVNRMAVSVGRFHFIVNGELSVFSRNQVGSLPQASHQSTFRASLVAIAGTFLTFPACLSKRRFVQGFAAIVRSGCGQRLSSALKLGPDECQTLAHAKSARKLSEMTDQSGWVMRIASWEREVVGKHRSRLPIGTFARPNRPAPTL